MTASQLKRHRGALGMTQQALAKRIGVHVITVAKWESAMVAIPKPIAELVKLLVAAPSKRRR
jgi:DNA-binding transcriptional regulator YiaG